MSQHINQSYTLSITINGPFLSSSNDGASFGVDTQTYRFFDKPAIPASLLKGALRQEFEQFTATGLCELTEADVQNWFGPSDSSSSNPIGFDALTQYARIDFGYIFQLTRSDQTKSSGQGRYENKTHRTRVKIGENDKQIPGMLQHIEDFYGAGASHTFTGKLHCRFKTATEQVKFERWFNKATASLSALGAFKNIGFGEVAGIEPLVPDPIPADMPVKLNSERLELRFSFDRPICIGTMRRPDANTLVSDTSIPGSTLLAVLARRIREQDLPMDAFDFNRLHMSFAHPAEPHQTPGLPKPLSLAFFGNDTESPRDLCREAQPQLLKVRDKLLWPSFHPDWKRDQKEFEPVFNDRQPLSHPPRLLNVRTAIDRSSGTADEGRLFAMECVDTRNHEWVAVLNLNQETDSQTSEAKKILGEVLGAPLDSIGKTRARTRRCVKVSEAPNHSVEIDERLITVLLTSPCRMLPSGFHCHGTESGEQLATAYQRYFHDCCDTRLSLVTFYAQQWLEGGEYYHRRFLRKVMGNSQVKSYQAELLTQAGSVFTFSISGKLHEGENIMKPFMELGLPSLPHTPPRDWESDPYIRENGYGRIVVNYPDIGSRETVDAETVAQ